MGNCQYVHHLYTSEATLNGEYYQHLLLPYTRDLGHSEVRSWVRKIMEKVITQLVKYYIYFFRNYQFESHKLQDY
jgi:hypothetical protein